MFTSKESQKRFAIIVISFAAIAFIGTMAMFWYTFNQIQSLT